MNYPSIDIQGSILSNDLLSKIRSEQASFQNGKDFNPDLTNAKLKDEISLAWQEAKGQYIIFKSKLARLKEGETGTTETRNFWMIPLLTNLGYNLAFNRQAEELNGKVFPIGYRDTILDNYPVYIGGYHESLDKRPENKQLRVSPHAMLQEFLNYSEHLYGLVSNGRQLRLLRDASRITRLSYVEFNLEKMMEEDLYSDFVILYRVLHASRMPKKMDGGAESIIEKYHQEGLEASSTIRSKLGDAVKEAILNLANEFINHPKNEALRKAFAQGQINLEEYYHHQLRIIYRLLFLFVIEERHLVYADSKTPATKRFNEIYFKHYSLFRMRQLARKLLPPEAERHYDLWQSLLSTFSLFEKKEIGEKLGIMALQGDLFGYHAISTKNYDLHDCCLSNAVLLNIIKSLSFFQNENSVLIAVNYGGLDVEEFGSVYEGLLELKINIKAVEGSSRYACSFDNSNERSKSGSHYTPEELVQPLIKHSLDYLIADRINEKVSSEWSVVSGKYPVIQKYLENLIINLGVEYAKLSGFGSLEKGPDISRADLPINSLLSQRRIIWDDFTAPKVSVLNTSQHSGGLGAKRQQGIQPIPKDSERQFEGNRNSPDASSQSESLQARTNSPQPNTSHNSGQTNTSLATIHLSEKQLTTIWQLLPETTRQSLFTTHHLLSLKVCDVACGSGHILLSATRRIAHALACLIETRESQSKEKIEQPSPAYVRKAMREVVRHCIYGVDKNPLAVELCKIALWLEAYNPGEPLTFLDHRIKCGDSIVGLAHRSELESGIADEAYKTLPGDDKDIAKKYRDKNVKERKERISKMYQSKIDNVTEHSVKEELAEYKNFNHLPETTSEEIEIKAQAYKKFMDGQGFSFLKALADTKVAQFFIPKTDANQDNLITDGEFSLILSGNKEWQDKKVSKATEVALAHRFFHWFIEFPEVFSEGGFDCVVGNPPFLGGQKLSGNFGEAFLESIKFQFSPIGAVDLVTYFFRRIFTLIKQGGFYSLISTNTIAQGNAREDGLDIIMQNGGSINHAIKSTKWPGMAAVEVALVTITKQKWHGKYILSGKEVQTITPYLDDAESLGNPFPLKINQSKSFQGSIVLGKGFILEPFEAQALIAKNKNNKEVLFPYLNGEDLNNSPEQMPSRWVINFFDWDELRAKQYPDCYEILERLVKPERQRLVKDEKGNEIIGQYVLRKPLPEKWWIYAEKRPGLYRNIAPLSRVLVLAQVSKTTAFTFTTANKVLDAKLNVFALQNGFEFLILQSNLHISWAWKFSSTMKTDLSYAPTMVFETFPFPKIQPSQVKKLDAIGDDYHEHRKQIMLGMQIGLTKTYNFFHSIAITLLRIVEKDKQVLIMKKHLEKTPNTISFDDAIKGILKLRELHVQMDTAVLDAYGWNDIQLNHNFYEVDYLPENDRTRYTIHPDARKEILKRLLALNHQIHEEELKAGLWEKKKPPSKKSTPTTVTETPATYGDLFEE